MHVEKLSFFKEIPVQDYKENLEFINSITYGQMAENEVLFHVGEDWEDIYILLTGKVYTLLPSFKHGF